MTPTRIRSSNNRSRYERAVERMPLAALSYHLDPIGSAQLACFVGLAFLAIDKTSKKCNRMLNDATIRGPYAVL
jgi:hypothetical protein